MYQKHDQNLHVSDEQYANNSDRSKQYICGCGKSYLSYPALFIHIKNKHEGKAPQGIIKPASKYGKRGRPPKQLKNKTMNSIVRNLQNTATKNQKQTKEKSQTPQFFIEQIKQQLSQISVLEIIRDDVWKEIQIYPIFLDYLNQGKLNCNKLSISMEYADPTKIPIGMGLKMFFDDLQQKGIQEYKFAQIFLLFCIYLQYVIDQLNKPAQEIIQNVPLDIFSEHLNSFVVDWMPIQTQELQLNELSLFKNKLILIRSLNIFFQWMICKRMSAFQVTLKPDFANYFA